MKRLLCGLGLHNWYENPETVRGYGNQPLRVRGCTRNGCWETQFKDGNGKWAKRTKEKFREFMFGIDMLNHS